MVLPSSGQISFSQISVEIGRNATASLSIRVAETDGYGELYCIRKCTTPYPTAGDTSAAATEWYSYDHSKAASTTGNYDGQQFSTEAALCADTNIPAGTTWYTYAPTNRFYLDDGYGICCKNCVANGYYKDVYNTTPQKWINISGCVGTTGSCTTTTTTTTCASGVVCNGTCCPNNTDTCCGGVCCETGFCNNGVCSV